MNEDRLPRKLLLVDAVAFATNTEIHGAHESVFYALQEQLQKMPIYYSTKLLELWERAQTRATGLAAGSEVAVLATVGEHAMVQHVGGELFAWAPLADLGDVPRSE